MTQLSENRRRQRLARSAGIAFGAAIVIAATTLIQSAEANDASADKVDLSYPRPGESAPMIQQGETNFGRPISGTPASADGHLIIDRLFRQRYAKPQVESKSLGESDDLEISLPEPPAVSAPKGADETVTPPATDEKPLG